MSKAYKYEKFYQEFDSPLMRKLRVEAYGEDIGQHSWVDADELRQDAKRVALNSSSRFLDLGCGPCGVLTFLIANFGCKGVGIELSPSAIEFGKRRAAKMGIQDLFAAHVGDLNEPIALSSNSFDVVFAIDVVLHLQNRLLLFKEIKRLLSPGGTFLFTDAGVVTGPVSNEEFQRRSVHGFTQFVPKGWNEQLLAEAGLRVVQTENRTASAFRNASGRLAALKNHQVEIERISGAASFQSQKEYLSTVANLSEFGAVSRFMYLVRAE